MSKQMDKIEDYGLSVNDLDVSPFESMEMLICEAKLREYLTSSQTKKGLNCFNMM